MSLKTFSLYNHVPTHYNSVKSHDTLFVSKEVLRTYMYVRTLYTSHIVFVVLTCVFIIPRVLCSYNKLAHVRNYVHVNIMEVPEYKNRVEKCNGSLQNGRKWSKW